VGVASREELLADLNPSQVQAVTHGDGPLLVVAGAGSGKTRVLTRRVAYLIAERGVSPFQILAITFTNKAADEMRSRVRSLVGPVADHMWVSTFHSACVRILRRDADQLGYRRSFTIYDQADSVRLTGMVVQALGLDPKRFPPRSLAATISQAKADLVDFESFKASAGSYLERKVAEVYESYQQRLVAASAMDFDDLLMVTVNLLQARPDLLEHYQRRFAHLLVDEYQDTNRAQNELVLMLGRRERNVCVVGDSDQSIYRFRGAEMSNILDFEQAFPDTTVVMLEQNYRSTQTILDAANAVIANNTTRKPKALWTDQGGGEMIRRYRAEDERDEAWWVAGEAEALHESGCEWGDLAIFYRTNAQSRVIEEELVRRGIPYKVIGGTRFYDRREVKDVLAYLRVLLNPEDEVSLRRILNVPRRGIGETSISRLESYASRHGLSLAGALPHAGEAGVGGKAARAVEAFCSLLDELRPAASTSAPSALEAVLDRTGYRAELESEGTVEAAGRLENLAELAGVAAEHEDVSSLLEDVSLVSDADELEDDPSSVSLMTLHTAKGLEFPAVFLVGMEDGVFPHMRALAEPAELEEERRLCYVGITRARRHLFVSHAWRRYLWGSTQFNIPSRFLRELPDALVHEEAGSAEAPGVHASGTAPSARSPGSPGESRAPGVQGGPSGSRPPTPARTKGAERLGLGAGDDVVHAKWGEGVVLEVRGTGEEAEAIVHFPAVGEKNLLLAWAPLKRA
jgi:DNA helicase-2/ATP-dependent DNA helicase PcrA